MTGRNRTYLLWGLGIPAVFLAARYLLPLFLPFLLGAGLALAAEPLVSLLARRLSRSAAAGLGVTATFVLLGLLATVLCGLLIRELGLLADVLPELLEAAQGGMASLEAFLTDLAAGTPEHIRPMLIQQIRSLFSDSSALLERATGWLLRVASGVLTRIPAGALGLGTGIIASFMISAKLPLWKTWLRKRLPAGKLQSAKNTLHRLKEAVFGWLKAQVKLSGITFGVMTVGFFFLGIRYAPLWGAAVAMVDAFPVLGTGAVLLPWSLISFLQGDSGRAFGLLGLYGGAAVIRSLLEPRLVGRQLGLDPLVTLMALYAGYRLWGLTGMLLSPIIAVTVTQLIEAKKSN